MPDDEKVLHRLRLIPRGLLGLGLAGTATELLLIGHQENPLQVAPLAVIGLSLASLFLRLSSPGGQRTFKAALLALVVCGLAGVAPHYREHLQALCGGRAARLEPPEQELT